SCPSCRSTERAPFGKDARVVGGQGVGGKQKVDKAWSGDLHSLYHGGRQRERCYDAVGHDARVAPLTLCELHRQIRGQITMRGIAWLLERVLEICGAKLGGNTRQRLTQDVTHSELVAGPAFFAGLELS